MTAFKPGQSPPPVNIPIFIACSSGSLQNQSFENVLSGNQQARQPCSALQINKLGSEQIRLSLNRSKLRLHQRSFFFNCLHEGTYRTPGQSGSRAGTAACIES